MALAGDTMVITIATGASVAPLTIDGIMQFSVSDSRDLYDITDFKDGNVHARIAGLRDYSLSLSGDLEPADTGYLALKAGYEAGTQMAVRTHFGGPQGASVGFMYLVQIENLEVSGSVDGKVELSTSLKASAGTAPFTHV